LEIRVDAMEVELNDEQVEEVEMEEKNYAK
jgi:hypothetical protein